LCGDAIEVLKGEFVKMATLIVKTVAVFLNCLLLVALGHVLWTEDMGKSNWLLFSFCCALPIVNLIAIFLPHRKIKNLTSSTETEQDKDEQKQ
jgi:hypothetical protein